MALSSMIALLALAAPAGAAGDGIPRPPGAIDNRGWELVSLADKNQSQVQPLGNLSSDGNSVWYTTVSGFDGSSSGIYVQLRATRTATGWQSRSMLPPRDEFISDGYFVMATKPDLTGWIATAQVGLGNDSLSPDASLVRLDDDGDQQLLHFFPVWRAFHSGVDSVASDDLGHVYAQTEDELDPSHQPGTTNAYDFGSGTPVLVSRMPGTAVAPLCGITEFALNGGMSVKDRRISRDGRYAFFTSRGDSCGDTAQLYVYDNQGTSSTSDDRTTLISGPPVGADTLLNIDGFLQATPDGSQVFYRTPTSLDAVDDADGNAADQDVYRYTTATGVNTCITCTGTVPTRVLAGTTITKRSAISQDGSHVYFLSAVRLADAPAAATGGAPNLYVWRDGTIHFIVRTDLSDLTNDPNYRGTLTPDGKVLIFSSARADLNRRSGSINNGTSQFYRYDDTDNSVTCLSCPASGATTAVPNHLLVNNQSITDDVNAIADDGRTVVFPTSDKLVAADVNGDVDLYEWHDGTLGLITDGRTVHGGVPPELLDVSPDGRDVVFEDIARLTPTATDSMFKIYDARVDGGFAPTAVAPACDGEACQGAPSAPPSLQDPGSWTLVGDGNATDAPPAATFSVARVTMAQRLRFAAAGRIDLSVHTSDLGTLSASAQAHVGKRMRTVGRSSATADADGSVKLTLRLSRAARTKLAKAGRLRVVLRVRYSETPGARRVVLVLRSTANGR